MLKMHPDVIDEPVQIGHFGCFALATDANSEDNITGQFNCKNPVGYLYFKI